MDETCRYRVLLVDDDPNVRESVAMLLNWKGYDVLQATDGVDALAQIRRMIPDVIISDLNMPRMSGFDLIPELHRIVPSIPVIAMSGSCESDKILPECIAADAYYAKGRHHPDKLLTILSGLLGNTRSCEPSRQ